MLGGKPTRAIANNLKQKRQRNVNNSIEKLLSQQDRAALQNQAKQAEFTSLRAVSKDQRIPQTMGGTLDVRRLSPNEEPASKVAKGRPAVSP